MKRFLILVVVLATPSMHGGILGWLTSQARDWQFIQRSGGIHVGAPMVTDRRRVLPVEYWPEGNSGLAVRKIELKRHNFQLVIRVFTQVVEKGSDTARVHHVDLAGIPAGPYEVYYETAGDPAKHLGHIDVK